MARFDRETGQLVLRVVYDGPSRAGKTTNVRSLASLLPVSRRSMVRTPAETPGGSTLRYDLLEVDVGRVDSARGEHLARCEVFSVPGQLSLASQRVALLAAADVAVLVLDATPGARRRNRVSLEALRAFRASGLLEDVPLVLQANKQDVAGALSGAALATELDIPARRVIDAIAVRGEGVRETFFAALEIARDAARPSLEADAVPIDEGSDPERTAGELEARLGGAVDRVLRALEDDDFSAS
ncbi:hypothetical protein [Sandaracinus amylolyticus]|uniref:hypothetical protein n=1 Tax=Sandaracinus amylolyticus TaxID=927083 RepID=UPI001F2C0E3A|nr:hypothetical protein [Sandaracinus amylolyticus]UJR85378.1 Hypothetical protein I5071_74580 [Sandaracinus amylolyticus]